MGIIKTLNGLETNLQTDWLTHYYSKHNTTHKKLHSLYKAQADIKPCA